MERARDYNWIFNISSTPEAIWIPVTNSNREYNPREAYELSEIFSRAVQRRSRYYRFKDLLDKMVEKAAKEVSNMGSEASPQLIIEVKTYLADFVDELSRDDSDDSYHHFKRGLYKRLRSQKSTRIQFVRTAQDTSKIYQSTKGDYWDRFQ